MSSYKLNEMKIFADVTEGIAVLINSDTGIYYGLNGFATNIYENIEKGASIEQIIEAVKLINGVPSTIEENIKLFVNEMLEKEIILSTDDSSVEVTIDENIAIEDNFVLELKEYNDAQELLLADPIHEVKEETGWTGEKDSIIEDKELVKQKEAKVEQ